MALKDKMFGDRGNPFEGMFGDIPGKIKGGFDSFMDSLNRGDNEFRQVDPQGNLANLAAQQQQFGQQAQQGFNQTGQQMQGLVEPLQQRAQGENLLSQLQLDQNLGRLQSQQQSMAAGAAPQNQAMASRNAAQQMSDQAMGMSGQAAMAGIAERQAAQNALQSLLGQMRGQDLRGALGASGRAMQGFGGLEDARTSRFNALTQTPTETEQALGGATDLLGFLGVGGE